MGEFHIKRIVLPSGKTVEIVYYQASDGERPVSDLRDIEAGAELHVRRLELCGGCGGERVHPTEWNEVEEMRWQLALRCPDCEWRHTDTYDAHDSLQRRKQPVKNVFWERTLPSINYRD